jgi:Cdc6-like AAA superfamily ATPase
VKRGEAKYLRLKTSVEPRSKAESIGDLEVKLNMRKGAEREGDERGGQRTLARVSTSKKKRYADEAQRQHVRKMRQRQQELLPDARAAEVAREALLQRQHVAEMQELERQPRRR